MRHALGASILFLHRVLFLYRNCVILSPRSENDQPEPPSAVLGEVIRKHRLRPVRCATGAVPKRPCDYAIRQPQESPEGIMTGEPCVVRGHSRSCRSLRSYIGIYSFVGVTQKHRRGVATTSTGSGSTPDTSAPADAKRLGIGPAAGATKRCTQEVRERSQRIALALLIAPHDDPAADVERH